MNRDQMIAHLSLQGWEPVGRPGAWWGMDSTDSRIWYFDSFDDTRLMRGNGDYRRGINEGMTRDWGLLSDGHLGILVAANKEK